MEWKCGARRAVYHTFGFDAGANTIVAFPVLGKEPADNVKLSSSELTYQLQ